MTSEIQLVDRGPGAALYVDGGFNIDHPGAVIELNRHGAPNYSIIGNIFLSAKHLKMLRLEKCQTVFLPKFENFNTCKI